MSQLSSKCATAISILSLASLPGDRSLFDVPLPRGEFTSTQGYERKMIGDTVFHAVDWNGSSGAESVFRETGRRSGRTWREFRAWRTDSGNRDIIDNGNKACALLLKHFGPYDQATSDALTRRRAAEKERAELVKALEKECPLPLRTAARDYLAPQLAYALRGPSPFTYIAAPILPSLVDPLTTERSLFSSEKSEVTGPLSSSELVLRDYIGGNQHAIPPSTLENVAKSILDRALPLEEKIDLLDIQLAVARLPDIPGEETPADMDRIHYGSLICRHRAVIVALLLADAGFDVELVEGTVSRDGHSGGHLFIFCEQTGILEPSADGPDFWRSIEVVSLNGRSMAITVSGNTVYTFGHRTKMKSL